MRQEKEQVMYSIAIDGPAGAGKSTIAKALSKKLGFVYSGGTFLFGKRDKGK